MSMQDDEFYIPPPGPNDNQSKREMVTAGEHQAVIAQLHNVGFQSYKGQVSQSPQAVIIFELDQKMVGGKFDGEPMVISQKYALYMGSGSALRKALEGWRGAPYSEKALVDFTIKKILHRPCTLMINHEVKKDGSKKAKIVGILPAKGPGWVPRYTKTPEWVINEKANQIHMVQRPTEPPQAANQGRFAEDDLPF